MRGLFTTVAIVLLAATTLCAQRNEREGVWIGIGAGPGSAGANCDNCESDRLWGFSGTVRVGGTVTKSLLIGVETNGWLGSDEEMDSRLGFLSVTATLFPSTLNTFFVKIGLGGMSYYAADVNTADELTALAPSYLAGVGYEFVVSRTLVVVPYFNYLASTSVDVKFNGTPVATSTIDATLIQMGLGLLWR